MSSHNLNMKDSERIIFMVLPIIDLIFCLYWILANIFSKSLRRSPGDLFIGIIIGELLLSIHWILSE